MENNWFYVRTCSRVSAGICDICKCECYFGAWRRDNLDVCPKSEILCSDCYLKEYQPEEHLARIKGIQEAEEERQRLIANPPPGSVTTENGGLFGPVQELNIGGFSLGKYRQVLKEPAFDATPIKTAISSNLNFFQELKKTSDS